MSDTRLRGLERIFQESNSVDDHATLIREQIRAGVLYEDRVLCAAWLNHEAAQIATQEHGVEFITEQLLGAITPMPWLGDDGPEFSPPVLRKFCMTALVMLRVRNHLSPIPYAVPFEAPHPDHVGLWARAQAMHDLQELGRTIALWEDLFGVDPQGVARSAYRLLTECGTSPGWYDALYQCWAEEMMLPWLLGQRQQFFVQMLLAEDRIRTSADSL